MTCAINVKYPARGANRTPPFLEVDTSFRKIKERNWLEWCETLFLEAGPRVPCSPVRVEHSRRIINLLHTRPHTSLTWKLGGISKRGLPFPPGPHELRFLKRRLEFRKPNESPQDRGRHKGRDNRHHHQHEKHAARNDSKVQSDVNNHKFH